MVESTNKDHANPKINGFAIFFIVDFMLSKAYISTWHIDKNFKIYRLFHPERDFQGLL